MPTVATLAVDTTMEYLEPPQDMAEYCQKVKFVFSNMLLEANEKNGVDEIDNAVSTLAVSVNYAIMNALETSTDSWADTFRLTLEEYNRHLRELTGEETSNSH